MPHFSVLRNTRAFLVPPAQPYTKSHSLSPAAFLFLFSFLTTWERINAQNRAAYAARKSVLPLQNKQDNDKIYPKNFVVPIGIGAKTKGVYTRLPDGDIAELTPRNRMTKVQTIARKGKNRQIDVR